MTLKLPVIKQLWCLEAIEAQYKNSLQRERQKRSINSSSNSPYAGQQDLNASGSFSSSQQEGGNNNNQPVPSTENNYRLLERKLEREREKITHGEPPPPPSRLDSKEETSSPAMEIRRNGFRLSGKSKSTHATRTAADQSTTISGSYRTSSNRDVLSSMGTLTVASTPSSAALRGQSIGFGSRDLSTRSPTHRSRTRGGMVLPLPGNDKQKNSKYPFVDPAHSASPSFQQRLSELAALESDTIRYERTKKIKKRSKQENQ